MPDAATIDELLRHIGLEARPAPDAEGLRRVHRAFVSRLAYDGLTAQLGEHAPIDPDRLVRRTLTTGRGGYCFEINTIMMALLEALGFTLERRQAVVGDRTAYADGRPTNHMALVATTREGERFLCDAGWGEGPVEPVPLRTGTVSTRAGLSWGLERDGDDGWWVTQHAWGSGPGFRFADMPSPLEAFAPHHERMATDPGSSFVQTLVVQQPTDEHITTLRARTLSRKGPARDERTVLADQAAFTSTLRDVFGIDPDALGAEPIARLWAQAGAQHEAFVLGTRVPPAPRPAA